MPAPRPKVLVDESCLLQWVQLKVWVNHSHHLEQVYCALYRVAGFFDDILQYKLYGGQREGRGDQETTYSYDKLSGLTRVRTWNASVLK